MCGKKAGNAAVDPGTRSQPTTSHDPPSSLFALEHHSYDICDVYLSDSSTRSRYVSLWKSLTLI